MTLIDFDSLQELRRMVIAIFLQSIYDLLAWLESHYFRFTQLPHSSSYFTLAIDLTRSKPELVLANVLLP